MKPKDQITIKSQTFGLHGKRMYLNSSLVEEEFIDEEQRNWGDLLTLARSRPVMFMGKRVEAHLQALGSAIRYVATTRPFEQPFSLHVVCSPTQYVVRCTAGPLLKVIERSVDWNTDRMLIDLLQDPCFNRTQGTTCQYGIHAVHLAERFFVGITSRSGFRHQTYREGWPTTDVLLLKEKTPYSFVIAGQLTSEWFTGLPFKWKEVQAVMKEYRSVQITWDMRTSDDVLPKNMDNMAELLKSSGLSSIP